MKEAQGFQDTGSVFIGSDLGHEADENAPFDNRLRPFIWFNHQNKLALRAYDSSYFTCPNTITNRSSSNHFTITWDSTDLENTRVNFYENGKHVGEDIKNISGSTDSGSFGFDALGSGYYNNTSDVKNTYGYSGSLGQVQFFDYLLTTQSIQALNDNPSTGPYREPISQIKFQGSHLIHEHEYLCTVGEHEYNNTMNISVRKSKSNTDFKLAGFVSSSYFKPYVTTIGLYNEYNELLVVGKLNQPIRMSDETDTTFVVRWDT